MSTTTETALGPVRAAAADLRLLRALPFATVCVVLAVAGHTMASGRAVPWDAVLTGWLATCAGAVVAARRERSLPAITGGLAAGQLGLHLLFQATQSAPGSRDAPGTADLGSMSGMPGMSGMSGMPGMAGSGSAPRPGVRSGLGAHPLGTAGPHAALWFHALWFHAALLGLSPAMLAGHLAATVAAGWWLRRGEVALWRLVRLTAKARAATAHACGVLLATLRTLFAAPPTHTAGGLGTPGPRPARRDGRPTTPGRRLLRHHVIRRGPPVAPAV
ncbi:hypothetical protein ACIGXM_12200 [Kitasatospora sp. NPDC052896]|uniref:hypothetical protein n=1 Tax=Kitasatospora sp. NPDC052896 TaxID=3364061 RepID=UPI0037C99470